MILTCPSCNTRYFAEDDAVGEKGRRVRCAACSHVWFMDPSSNADGANTDRMMPDGANVVVKGPTRQEIERARAELRSPPAHEIAKRKRQERERDSRVKLVAGLWAGTGIAAVALFGAAFLFRSHLVQFWPRSAAAFAAIGAPVNPFGLDFVDVKAERKSVGATQILEIAGSVRNVSKNLRAVPLVRVGLRNPSGKEVYAWSLRLDNAELNPGATASFGTQLESPPLTAFALEVRFEKKPSAALIASTKATTSPLVDAPSRAALPPVAPTELGEVQAAAESATTEGHAPAADHAADQAASPTEPHH